MCVSVDHVLFHVDHTTHELMDLCNSIKNGQLFLQNPIDKVSHTFLYVATPTLCSLLTVGVARALLCAHTKTDYLYW